MKKKLNSIGIKEKRRMEQKILNFLGDKKDIENEVDFCDQDTCCDLNFDSNFTK
jgi:hypothetical protein